MASISEAVPSATPRTAIDWREHRADVLWWAFVAINAWAIVMLRAWATVPFHFIWIGISLMYGWRVWSMRATVISLAVVCLVLPSVTVSEPGPEFTGAQLAFAAIASLALYGMFVFTQTIRHRDFFLPVAARDFVPVVAGVGADGPAAEAPSSPASPVPPGAASFL